jgi:glutamyl-tRNA reductase
MLCVIGLNYKNSSIEEREKFSVQKPDTGFTVRHFYERLGLKECVVLSTCNRFELYCVIGAKSKAKQAAAEIADYFKAGAGLRAEKFYTLFDEAAACWLFSVAAGLDSMVIGEPQILSQVKFAYSSACEVKTTGYLLNKLFHQAIKIGKSARSETAISENAASVSGAAVAAAKKELGEISGLSALLIGAGETAELALECLIKAGVKNSAVISRTLEHAEALAAKYGAKAYELTSLYKLVRGYDIIISSTDSPHYIINFERFKEAAGNNACPLSAQLIIDLAVPRDIDPRVAGIKNVKLYNIDDLGAIINTTVAGRKTEALKVAKIIEAGARDFKDWYEGRGVKPFIEKFRSNIENIVAGEIDKFAKKIPDTVKNKEKSLDALKQAIINRICDRPISKAQLCSRQSKIQSCISNFECFFSGECRPECYPENNGSSDK